VWLPVAVLTPLWSTCPQRNAQAAVMLDRVVTAIPSSRAPHTPPRTDDDPRTARHARPAPPRALAALAQLTGAPGPRRGQPARHRGGELPLGHRQVWCSSARSSTRRRVAVQVNRSRCAVPASTIE